MALIALGIAPIIGTVLTEGRRNIAPVPVYIPAVIPAIIAPLDPVGVSATTPIDPLAANFAILLDPTGTYIAAPIYPVCAIVAPVVDPVGLSVKAALAEPFSTNIAALFDPVGANLATLLDLCGAIFAAPLDSLDALFDPLRTHTSRRLILALYLSILPDLLALSADVAV